MKINNLYLIVIFIHVSSFNIAQVFLNGDFEINLADTCDFNNSNVDFNSKIDHVVAFGPASTPGGSFLGEMDFQTHGCPFSPQNGDWCLSLTAGTFSSTDTDEISIELSTDLVAGETYRISFYGFTDSFENSLKIGYSSSDTYFGMLIYTATMNNNAQWNRYEFDFTPTIGARFITVKNTANMYGWNAIDNFEINKVLSVDNLKSNDISIYPNPSSTEITMQIPENISGKIKIVSSEGVLVYEEKLENSLFPIDVSTLTKGLYVILIETENELISRNFIKSN